MNWTREQHNEVVKALAVAAEVIGQGFSDAAAAAIVERLKAFEAGAVVKAVSRCMDECKGRMSLADIIERMDDGHPGVEEAFSMIAHGINDEGATLVMTEPMRQAFFAAYNVGNDRVAARMAFKEVYEAKVTEARRAGVKPTWVPSLGHNVQGREDALVNAAKQGLIPYDDLPKYLPAISFSKAEVVALLPARDGKTIALPIEKKTEAA